MKILYLAAAFVLLSAVALAQTLSYPSRGLGKSYVNSSGDACLDLDGDGYGTGPACTGPDANDNDFAVNVASTIAANVRYGNGAGNGINTFLIAKSIQDAGSPATVWCISTTGSGSPVTPGGNTNADTACDSNHAYATWTDVSGSLASPYIVLYRGGTWTCISMQNPPSGTSGRQNYIMAYPGELPIIDDSNYAICGANDPIYLLSSSAGVHHDYITFSGFRIKGNANARVIVETYNTYPDTFISTVGDVLTRLDISLGGNTSNPDSNVDAFNNQDFQFVENVVHDTPGQHNVYMGANGSNSTGIRFARNILYNDASGYGNFSYNGRCTADCHFDQNWFYNSREQHISLYMGVSNATVDGNLLFNSGSNAEPPLALNIRDYPSGQCHVNGLPDICPYDQNGNVISNNTIWTGTNFYLNGAALLTGAALRVLNDTTSAECTPFSLSAPCRNVGGNTYQNNIIVGNGSYVAWYNDPAILALDHWYNNILWSRSVSSTVLATGNGPDNTYTCAQMLGLAAGGSTGCTNSDPGFKNATASNYSSPNLFDFRLATGSAALAAGRNTSKPTYDVIGHSFFQPPSIGAYEGQFAEGWTQLDASDSTCTLNDASTVAAPRTSIKCVQFKPTGAGSEPVRGVIDDWSGGTARVKAGSEQLAIWGGGHAGSCDNAVYALSIYKNPPVMERLTDRSTCDATLDVQTYTADSAPRSRHTYGGLWYKKATDEFHAASNMAVYPQAISKSVNSHPSGSWKFDFSSLTWATADYTASGDCTASLVGPCDVSIWDTVDGPHCGHDDVSGRVLCFTPATSYVLTEMNEATGVWKSDNPYNYGFTGAPYGTIPIGTSGVIDTNAQSLFFIGSAGTSNYGGGVDTTHNIRALDISGSAPYTSVNKTSDDGSLTCDTLTKSYAPGLVYDPTRNKIVGLPSESSNTVYLMDPVAHTCTTASVSGTGPGVGPNGVMSLNGLWGRFAYFPTLDVYVLVSQWDQSAYVLNLNSGGGGLGGGGGDGGSQPTHLIWRIH